MTSFSECLDEMLKDPEFKAEYDALESEFAAIQTAIDAEKEAKLAQKELLDRDGIA